MVANRLVEIFELMAKGERENAQGVSLCSVSAEITELSGASVLLTSSTDQVTTFCSSGGVARTLMELEMTWGEGPGHEAIRSGVVNEEALLSSPEEARWIGYSSGALAAGARAVFGFPIRVGAVRFGALSLYRDEPGVLSHAQSSDAYLMASVIGRAVLALLAGAAPEEFVAELERQSPFDVTVHQAVGMLAQQASLSVRDAFVALRAHSFATNSSLSTLAERVVTRRLRLEPVTREWRDEPGNIDS